MTGYLGLGSNVGDRRAHLEAAVAALPLHGVDVLASSSVYETEPVGEVLEQREFLNACVRVATDLEPEPLLDACKAVERELGRAPGGVRHPVRFYWQPVAGVNNTDPKAVPNDKYLFDELKDRLRRWPARFMLMMTIGEEGDALDDCTKPWPGTRLRIAFAEGSNSRANSLMLRPVRASSIIGRRYSAAYGGYVLGIGVLLSPFSPTPSTKTGQLHRRHLPGPVVRPSRRFHADHARL